MRESAARFFTVTPCRVLDSRLPDEAFAGLPLEAGEDRELRVAATCGVPSSAKAVALNLTVTDPTTSGHVLVYPAGTSRPLASTVNFQVGQTRASNAVVALGPGGDIRLYSGQPAGSAGTVHVVVDVTGYFE